MQADKGFTYGSRQIGVHSEVLARPIDGDAEALHLVQDGGAVLFLPFPNPLQKRFTTELLA